jgi:hypothetical protein
MVHTHTHTHTRRTSHVAGGFNGLGIISLENVDPEVAPRNVAQAVSYFEQAAERGHLSGLYNLALLILKGHAANGDPKATGGGRQFKKALNYFTAAAQQGHVRSADAADPDAADAAAAEAWRGVASRRRRGGRSGFGWRAFLRSWSERRPLTRARLPHDVHTLTHARASGAVS